MGNNTKNYIEINGNRYDALTGALLAHDGAGTPVVRRHAQQASQSIDGFRRVSRSGHTAQLQPVAARAVQQPPVTQLSAKPKAPRSAHKPAVHAVAHTPQKGQTLMRSAVKKPTIKSPTQLKAIAPTDVLAKVPARKIAPKISYYNVDPNRDKRATRVIKSPAVSRYGGAVKPAQSTQPAFVAAAQRPQPALVAQARPHAAMPALPVRQQPPVKKERDIFEEAIAQATSHQQTYSHQPDKKRSRFAGYFSASLVTLLLISFLAYQNLPSLSLRLASSRAGIEARMPGYQPNGFTFGDLKYSPGNISVSYASTEDASKKYNITQRSSTWDSEALLSNFVISTNDVYKTYERAGRTIYLYGSNTATWVDSGIWYTVSGGGALSTDQLLDLASSM